MERTDKNMLERLANDPLYGPVIDSLIEQQRKGIYKYDTLLTLEKWDVIEYIEHAQQELTDGNIYLEGVKQHLKAQAEGNGIEKAELLRRNRTLEALNKQLGTLYDDMASNTARLEKQIGMLADFILEKYPHEIRNESAVEVAIRLLNNKRKAQELHNSLDHYISSLEGMVYGKGNGPQEQAYTHVIRHLKKLLYENRGK